MKKVFSAVPLFFVLFFSYSQHSFNRDQLINDLKVLSADSLEGRKVGTKGNQKASRYIVNRLQEMNVQPLLSPDYLQPFTFSQQRNGANILAVIEGRKKETFVISAHYDHVGIINNKIYNGADDNASGTSALLAIAEYFVKNPPEHRFILAFFDAEESGLRGSEHFVKTMDLKNEKIVLNINMDMVSRSDKNELYASGTFYYPELKKPLEDFQSPGDIKLLFGHDDPSKGRDDWTNQSDQRNFHKQNIPFVYFGVEDHADYHKPTDTFEKINQDFFSNSTELILRAIKSLDKDLP